MASLLQHKERQVTKNTKAHVHPINILSATDQGEEPEVPGASEDENKEDIDGEIQSKSNRWTNLISICICIVFSLQDWVRLEESKELQSRLPLRIASTYKEDGYGFMISNLFDDSYWPTHCWRGSLRGYIIWWYPRFLIRSYDPWGSPGVDLQHFRVPRITLPATWCRYQYPLLYRHVYAQWNEVWAILATTMGKASIANHLCRWDTDGAWACYRRSPPIWLSCVLSCWSIRAVCTTWSLVCVPGELSSGLWSRYQLCKVGWNQQIP